MNVTVILDKLNLRKRISNRAFMCQKTGRDLSTNRKFIVVQMRDDDFVNLDALNPYFRKAVTGIRSMQWLHFEKASLDTLFYKKCSGDSLEKFSELDMKSKRRGREVHLLPHLPKVTEKNCLKNGKYRDLIEQLVYVPPVYHAFYQNLSTSNAQVIRPVASLSLIHIFLLNTNNS